MIKTTKRILASLASAVILSATIQAQQLKTPAPSPTQTVKQAFGLSEVTVDYSRPSVKGRVIYGDVVPFGKIWRTGANAATKITFGEDVKVNGTAVAAGTYAIYTIPNKDSWELMLYKDLTLGGNVTEYKQENELLRLKVKVTPLAEQVETFTIDFADMTSTSMKVEFLWEKTRAEIVVTSDIDAKVMKNIETALANDSRPYFQAANYYYENNKDMNKALEWVNKATEQNPKAFYMFALKAKIQIKLKDAKGAGETAAKVIELSKAAKNDDYVKIGENLQTEAAKMK